MIRSFGGMIRRLKSNTYLMDNPYHFKFGISKYIMVFISLNSKMNSN